MRIKSGVTTRHHKKKFFKLAKGNYSAKRTRWRMVKQQVEQSLNRKMLSEMAVRDEGSFKKLVAMSLGK